MGPPPPRGLKKPLAGTLAGTTGPARCPRHSHTCRVTVSRRGGAAPRNNLWPVSRLHRPPSPEKAPSPQTPPGRGSPAPSPSPARSRACAVTTVLLEVAALGPRWRPATAFRSRFRELPVPALAAVWKVEWRCPGGCAGSNPIHHLPGVKAGFTSPTLSSGQACPCDPAGCKDLASWVQERFRELNFELVLFKMAKMTKSGQKWPKWSKVAKVMKSAQNGQITPPVAIFFLLGSPLSLKLFCVGMHMCAHRHNINPEGLGYRPLNCL